MFHQQSIRIVMLSVVSLGILLSAMSLFSEKEKKYEYRYKIGECAWHINQSKNPDGTYKRNIFKIIGTIELEGEPYYITDVINWHYRFNHFSPKLASADYYDKYHPSKTHEEKCTGFIEKAEKECLKNKNYEFVSGGIECPTREEYCKELKEKTGEDCWEKK
jgi:hypothetical protein